MNLLKDRTEEHHAQAPVLRVETPASDQSTSSRPPAKDPPSMNGNGWSQTEATSTYDGRVFAQSWSYSRKSGRGNFNSDQTPSNRKRRKTSSPTSSKTVTGPRSMPYQEAVASIQQASEEMAEIERCRRHGIPYRQQPWNTPDFDRIVETIDADKSMKFYIRSFVKRIGDSQSLVELKKLVQQAREQTLDCVQSTDENIFKMKEQCFSKFVSLISRQGPFIAEMSKSLSFIIEHLLEGSLGRCERFMLERTRDTDILEHPKGSEMLLAMMCQVGDEGE